MLFPIRSTPPDFSKPKYNTRRLFNRHFFRNVVGLIIQSSHNKTFYVHTPLGRCLNHLLMSPSEIKYLLNTSVRISICRLTLLCLHPSNPSTTPCAAPPWPGWAGTAAGGRTGGSSHMTSPKLCRRCRAWATRPPWAWEPPACDRLDGAARVTRNARTSRSPAVCPRVRLPATDAPYCQNALLRLLSGQPPIKLFFKKDKTLKKRKRCAAITSLWDFRGIKVFVYVTI